MSGNLEDAFLAIGKNPRLWKAIFLLSGILLLSALTLTQIGTLQKQRTFILLTLTHDPRCLFSISSVSNTLFFCLFLSEVLEKQACVFR